MKKKEPIRLNLGCGVAIISGFVNIDKFYTLKQLQSKRGIFKQAVIQPGGTFVQADMCALPFKDDYADYIETIDAVEHISFRKVQLAFNEMFRVLKPGGKLQIMTTNFDQLADVWTKSVAGRPLNEPMAMMNYLNLMEVIYGNQLYAGEYHVTPMNPYFLGYLLHQAGFKSKKIKVTVFPMGSHVPPSKMKTQKWEKNALTRTEMLVVEAVK